MRHHLWVVMGPMTLIELISKAVAPCPLGLPQSRLESQVQSRIDRSKSQPEGQDMEASQAMEKFVL